MNRLRARLRVDDPERGITLAEILVYCALLGLVLPLVGTLLHGTLVAQRDVQAVNAASTAAQTVAASVEAGVRNASAMQLTPYANTGSVPKSELLVVRTRTGTASPPQWACQAWYYDAVAQTIRTRRVVAGTSALARPVTATAPGWTELARGVRSVARPGAVVGPLGPPVFTASSGSVQIGLTVDAGQRQPVVLSTTITQRPQGETASQPCF